MADPTGDPSAAPEASRASTPRDQTPFPGKGIRLFELAGVNGLSPAAAAFPMIAGYEILAELGRGGMGVVYKARDLDLNRLVAIKMILGRNLASPERMIRFMVEGATIARLQHPHIVQVYEVGQHEGIPFIALEYVAGGTLDQKLQRESFAPLASAALIEQLARAMHHAHLQGVVHRDLKPGNILLQEAKSREPRAESQHVPFSALDSRLSALDSPKITDFGLAKQVDSELMLTETGAIMGTPGYMAPEQARSAKRIGPAVDIHALGAILYELLTGFPPYRGETPAETVMQVLQAEPPPPRRWQTKVPRDLEIICLKCLEKDPGHRYASALELADDLQRFREGRPIKARPSSIWEWSSKWARRRPAIAGLLLAVALSTLVGVASLIWAVVQAQGRMAAEHTSKLHAEARATSEAAAKEKEAELRRQAEIGLYYSRIAQTELTLDKNDVTRARLLLRACVPTGEDHRGWEWHYLNRQCHAELKTLQGHQYWINGVAFSPNGRWLASAGGTHFAKVATTPGEIRLWEAATGKPVAALTGHTGGVWEVFFSPDSQRLISTSFDGTVRVWDLSSLRELFRLPVNPVQLLDLGDAVTDRVAFAPDFSLLAHREGDEARVAIWDLNAGQAVRTIADDRVGGKGMAFDPSGRRLALTGKKRTVSLWDVASGRLLRTWDNADGWLAFSPDGRYLACHPGTGDPLLVWETESGRLAHTFAGYRLRFTRMGPRHLHFAADSRKLLVLVGGTNQLKDFQTGKEHTLAFKDVGLSQYTIEPSGRLIACAGADQTVRLYDADSGNELHVYRGHTSGVLCVAFSPDGRRLASAGQDASVRVWDATRDPRGCYLESPLPDLWGEYLSHWSFAAEGREFAQVYGQRIFCNTAAPGAPFAGCVLTWHGGYFSPRNDLAFSGDGRWVAVAAASGNQLLVWDTASRRQERILEGLCARPRAVTLNRDGSRIAAAAIAVGQGVRRDGQIKVWERDSGREALALSNTLVCALALSPDGQHLAGAGIDDRMRVWDMARNEEWSVPFPRPRFASLAFSPDGRALAAGSFGTGAICVWDAQTGISRFTATGPGNVTGLAFSPNGRRLAAVGYDADVTLWDAETGKDVLILRHLGNPRPQDYSFTARVAFSPDGRAIAANDWRGRIGVWSVDAPVAADIEAR